jgi:RimJ/RimL family protein N-acetyltransferase
MDYVFRNLGVNRLDINQLNVNIGWQRVIEKRRFKLESEKDVFLEKRERVREYEIFPPFTLGIFRGPRIIG